MTRYILHPGYVRSKHDGDLHFISAQRLIQLYGVPQADCIDAKSRGLRSTPGDIHLRPRLSGVYRIPKPNS